MSGLNSTAMDETKPLLSTDASKSTNSADVVLSPPPFGEPPPYTEEPVIPSESNRVLEFQDNGRVIGLP